MVSPTNRDFSELSSRKQPPSLQWQSDSVLFSRPVLTPFGAHGHYTSSAPPTNARQSNNDRKRNKPQT